MSTNIALEGKLSNVQFELMKLFATNVSESHLIELKKILLEFNLIEYPL